MFLDICDLFHNNSLSDSFQQNERYKFRKDLFLDRLELTKMCASAMCKGIILKESWFLILNLGWVADLRHLNKMITHDQNPWYIRDMRDHGLSQSILVGKVARTSWCSRQLLNLNKHLFRAQGTVQ